MLLVLATALKIVLCVGCEACRGCCDCEKAIDAVGVGDCTKDCLCDVCEACRGCYCCCEDIEILTLLEPIGESRTSIGN